jgi:hypothetical protein
MCLDKLIKEIPDIKEGWKIFVKNGYILLG